MIATQANKYAVSGMLAGAPKTAEADLTSLLTSEDLFRMAYVPFVVAGLVWDYVDSVLGLAAQMRIAELKPLCRAVRRLRADYDRQRSLFFDATHIAREQENMIVYEDGVADIMSLFLRNVKADIEVHYPQLQPAYRYLLSGVYQCVITLDALFIYTSRQEDALSRKVRKPVGHILPASLRTLRSLLPQFIGDKPASSQFAAMCSEFSRTFAAQMGLVGIADKSQGENQTQDCQS